MRMVSMDSIPAGANPFHHDGFHMGIQISDSVMMMHPYWDYYTDQHPLIVAHMVEMGYHPSQKNMNELPWLRELWENRK